ncbi:hypothetical protein K437DRAFT_258349 [Tilletiaria anomala UBC 951]|uniref:Origin recognition complex subunit 2 n=1 Tax=Tilletiaria anomala (strain ATCC 24038 / CBS 436.72 / UBC 951) TaxID=1037660 RepID=A0A066VR18_TILAU|nr:uncharacterized protein K437DRAFT_258349 [Tilletiaria anomala UBC 951]KDN41239.1 hypothetical protein K437DRAFT_258349 [Tilletiaria anomala UBC 951]
MVRRVSSRVPTGPLRMATRSGQTARGRPSKRETSPPQPDNEVAADAKETKAALKHPFTSSPEPAPLPIPVSVPAPAPTPALSVSRPKASTLKLSTRKGKERAIEPTPSQESVGGFDSSQRSVHFSQNVVDTDDQRLQLQATSAAACLAAPSGMPAAAEIGGSHAAPHPDAGGAPPPKRTRINFEDKLRADTAAARAASATVSTSDSLHADSRTPALAALSGTLPHRGPGVSGPSESMLRRSSADHYFEAFAASSASRKKKRVTSDALISELLPDLTTEMVAELYDLPTIDQPKASVASASVAQHATARVGGRKEPGSSLTGSGAGSAFNTQVLEEFNINIHRRTSYAEWTLLLSQGFKLLFHGVGSPEAVLQDYVEQRARGAYGTAVVVRGYMPGLRIEKLLEAAESATAQAGEQIWDESSDEETGGEKANGEDEQAVRLEEDDQSVKHANHLEARAHRLRQKYTPVRRSKRKLLPESKIQTGTRTESLPPLYLLLIGVDNKTWLSSRAQRVLAILARAPRIYLLATASHINSGLLLLGGSSGDASEGGVTAIPWLWQDLNTFVPPIDEMLVSSSNMAHKGISLPRALSLHLYSHAGRAGAENFPHGAPSSASTPAAAGLAGRAGADHHGADDEELNVEFSPHGAISILQSVTVRAKKLFRLIASMQVHLDEGGDRGEGGACIQPPAPRPVLFSEVLDRAMRDYTATSDDQMRSLLPEYTSHSLLRIVKWSDANPQLRSLQPGKEYLWINMSRQNILHVLSQLEQLVQ